MLNKKSPTFKLKDKDGTIHELSKIKSDYTIVYFYPKDNTPGCTLEAKEFSKLLPEFKKLKTEIIGISGGDEKSKSKFCEKNRLSIILLSDPDFKVSTTFGVYGKKKFMGKEYFGISRTTFILDKNKKIIKIFENVKPIGHAKEVLEFIKSLKKPNLFLLFLHNFLPN